MSGSEEHLNEPIERETEATPLAHDRSPRARRTARLTTMFVIFGAALISAFAIAAMAKRIGEQRAKQVDVGQRAPVETSPLPHEVEADGGAERSR